MDSRFQLIQILYWLALSTWFGGALFIAVVSRAIFKTVQENNPILPEVLSVNLEGQHGTLLAGTIMGNIFSIFLKIELGCAVGLAVALGAQYFVIDLHNRGVLMFALLRSAMLLAAGAVVIYEWRVVWPRMWKHRQEFLDHADEPEKANPAKDEFDRYQKESVTLLQIVLFLLLGMVLFSAGVAESFMHAAPAESPGAVKTSFLPGTRHAADA